MTFFLFCTAVVVLRVLMLLSDLVYAAQTGSLTLRTPPPRPPPIHAVIHYHATEPDEDGVWHLKRSVSTYGAAVAS